MSIDVVSTYGIGNASVRSRLIEPLNRIGVRPRFHSYFESATTVQSGLKSEWKSVARSEVELRRLLHQQIQLRFLSREAGPFSRGGLEASLLRKADFGVLDLDDALHLDVRRDFASRLFPKPPKVFRTACAADVVIAGNEFIADWVPSCTPDVRVIPTCVDVSRYRVKTSYELFDRPRLVWLGTRSGERYLAGIAKALQECHRQTGARLTIIGDGNASTPVGLEDLVDRVAWRPNMAELCLADFDVGLMPLVDSAYERGKCAFKLLQYGAAGLPALASPVGVNRGLLQAGRLPAPQSLVDWKDALMEVLGASAMERERRGRALRELVQERFDFSVWLTSWSSILRDAGLH